MTLAVSGSSTRRARALLYAAAFNMPKTAKVLIKAGANVNVRNGDGHTALRIATHFGNREITVMLKKAGGRE